MQQVEIRVKGQIDRDWSDWFDGLTITYPPRNESILTGPVRDQAELRGMICRLADLGLELISFTTLPRVQGTQENFQDEEVIDRRKENKHHPQINKIKRKEEKMKKLYITLIALTLAVATIAPVGVVSADPAFEDVQAFLNQYNVAANPAVKTTVANLALQQPDSVAQMAVAYASISPAGATFVAGPTGTAGTPVVISVGGGNYIATMM